MESQSRPRRAPGRALDLKKALWSCPQVRQESQALRWLHYHLSYRRQATQERGRSCMVMFHRDGSEAGESCRPSLASTAGARQAVLASRRSPKCSVQCPLQLFILTQRCKSRKLRPQFLPAILFQKEELKKKKNLAIYLKDKKSMQEVISIVLVGYLSLWGQTRGLK